MSKFLVGGGGNPVKSTEKYGSTENPVKRLTVF